jgi:hypothetical protein
MQVLNTLPTFDNLPPAKKAVRQPNPEGKEAVATLPDI